MNLKIGDNVILRKFEENNCIGFVINMEKFVGTKTTITAIYLPNTVHKYFSYKVANNDWTWINLKKINSIKNKLK